MTQQRLIIWEAKNNIATRLREAAKNKKWRDLYENLQRNMTDALKEKIDGPHMEVSSAVAMD